MNKNTALITGASSGIGKEIALIHAQKGNDLVIVATNKEKLELLKEEIEKKYNSSVYIIKKDLTLKNSPKEIYDELKEKNIIIEYLINNAGVGGQGSFSERALEDERDMINLNIIALVSLTKLFLDDFIKRDRGRILNVSSVASLIPGPLQAIYFASKSFVTSFSYALNEELKETSIKVTTLLPGATASNFSKRAGLVKTSLFKNTTSAKKVATKGYNAMIKGKMNAIVGVNPLNVIAFKFLPVKLFLKIIKQKQKI